MKFRVKIERYISKNGVVRYKHYRPQYKKFLLWHDVNVSYSPMKKVNDAKWVLKMTFPREFECITFQDVKVIVKNRKWKSEI